jgi:hypothetical protein
MPPGPAPSTDAPADTEEGPPEPGPAGTSRQEARNAIIQVNGAGALALVRCREVAGAKIRQAIRTKSRGAVELGMIDGIPNADVACTLGEERIREMGLPQPLELVKSGTDGFRNLLTDWGFDRPQASVLAEMLLVFAGKTLYESKAPSLPAGFLAQVERLKELTEEKIVRQNNDSLAMLEEMMPGARIKGG